jgi:predicted RND superfamily exporter protein
MNGLSGNLPILTLVNGLEDVVHLLVFFFATRRRAGPVRAAATAFRECVIPNFLTSLTTFGALIVTGATDMVLLQSFGYAICIGVVVEYVLAIVYLPLVLMIVPWRIEGCLFYRLEAAVSNRWLAPWNRLIKRPGHLVAWIVVCVALIACSWSQQINSNWHRYFVKNHAVTRSMEFLGRHRFPATQIDCTIPVDRTVGGLLGSTDVEDDLEAIAAAVRKVPGVVRVDTWVDVKRFCDDRIARAAFDPALDPKWQKARREALYRQYLELGAFDEYFCAPNRKLRLVVSSTVEDSSGLMNLSRRVLDVARTVPTRVLDCRELVCAGRTAYWGEVMGYVSSTFVMNLVYSVLFIFVVFLFVTRNLTLSLVAMVPNVMPVFVMFTVARIFGYHIHEGFCVIDSLAIGNSVNDTIHYLFHLQANQRKGADPGMALTESMREVGCSMTISSLLVAIGTSACLGAEGIAVILFGGLMSAACIVAVAMDVFMNPAMLWFLRRRW